MTLKSIKILLVSTIIVSAISCTSNFEDINTNPNKVSDNSLKQDFNDIGSAFPGMIRVLVNTETFKYQVAENLVTDSWAGYFAPPTPFGGGANNTTYKMVWKDRTWIDTYDEIMSPAKRTIELAEKDEKPQFKAWAKLIRIYGMQKVASLHGPVIYSNYGKSATVSHYDSEKDLYNEFFKDLDTINSTLMEYKDFEGFQNFDVAYGGNIRQWIKLSNSLRLMLALRLSNVSPDLAQEQAEKATSQTLGVLQSNADNFTVDLGSKRHPLNVIGYDYNDTRMSATMESFLVGFQDPRIGKYFTPVSEENVNALVSDHPNFPYKGIKNGAVLIAKDKRLNFSNVGEYFTTNPAYTLLNFADVNFMLAEAKLRGWAVGSKSVQEYYEEGVRASFDQWGASGVDDYLANDTDVPIDYNDPVANSTEENAFDAQTDITIKWNEGASNARKLERIITQKWIAGFPNSFQPWVDFRRTGYPAIEPVYKNDSNESDGVIAPGDYIKRMRFVPDEYAENPKGVADAVKNLNGPDKISTPLWWDVDDPNF